MATTTTATPQAAEGEAQPTRVFNAVKKSSLDPFNYRMIRLPNNLTALLIQDAEAVKSAAALATHTGSMQDPRDWFGIAHFTEHMLFMGSEKYPDQGEYKKFITDHGGSDNAYTSLTITNYYFDIAKEAFYEGLDRFAQFYICPLMKEECVNKEINAVHSEYEYKLNMDGRRLWQLERSLAKEDSIYNKFSVGNLETLKKDGLVEQLKKFHGEWYSSNQMALVVVAPEELDHIQEKVEAIFSPVIDKKIEYKGFSEHEHPYPPENLKKLIKVVPVKDKDTLYLTFKLPSFFKTRKNKSLKYLSHVLGHEAEGTILNFLIEEGLATDLSAGASHTEDLMSEVELNITLTKEGLKNWENVVSVVGEYISILKKEGAQEWVYQEIKEIGEMQFRFPEKSRPMQMAHSYAARLVKEDDDEDLENFIYNKTAFRGFNKEEIDAAINLLTVDNLLITLVSKSVEGQTDREEKYYAIKHKVEDLSEEVIKAFNEPNIDSFKQSSAKLKMITKNELIPTDFDVLPIQPQSTKIAKIDEREDSEVWYQQDDVFKLPKVCLGLKLYTGDQHYLFYDSRNYTLKKLWADCFNDYIRGFNYSAEEAECKFSFCATQRSYELKGKCYSHSLKPYLNNFVKYLAKFCLFDVKNFRTDKKKFGNLKQDLLRKYKDALKNTPLTKAIGHLKQFLTNTNLNKKKIIQELETLTYDDFKDFCQKKAFESVRFEWLIEGNITAEDAKFLALNFEHQLLRNSKARGAVLPKSGLGSVRPINMVEGHRGIIEAQIEIQDEKNGSYVEIWEAGQSLHANQRPEVDQGPDGEEKKQGAVAVHTDDDMYVELFWLDTWLHELFFEELRTNQQLGYVAYTRDRIYSGAGYFTLCIQSNVKSTDHCRIKTREFLDESLKILENLTEEDFEKIKKGCVSKIIKKYDNLYAKFKADFGEIYEHQYVFDRKKKRGDAMQRLTKERMVEFYKGLFGEKGRKLEFHQYSPGDREEGEKIREKRLAEEEGLVFYGSFSSFVARQGLHPDVYAIAN